MDSPFLLALLWLVSLWLLGWLMLPVSRRIFPNLPDGGLAAGRTLLLVLVGLLCFWLASLSIVSLSLAPVLLIGIPLFLAIWPLRRTAARREFFAWVETNRRTLLFSDVIYLLVFLFFLYVRARHAAVGDLEKPMDSALMAINARASYLPPPHPWFGGEVFTNYYYFFHFIGGLLMRTFNTPPAYGYNLVYPLFCALFVAPLWSLCAALTKSLKAGVLAAAVVALLGHFEPLRQLFVKRAWPLSWWDTSRVIPDTINEYPAFTLLIGDAHGHFFALAVAALFFCLCYALFWPASQSTLVRGKWLTHRLLVLTLLGLVSGAFVMGNTWDAPLYVLLALACGFATLEGGRKQWRSLRGFASLLPLILAPFVALPYLTLYKSQISGVAFEWWTPPGGSFLLFWAGFLALWLFAAVSRAGFKVPLIIAAVLALVVCFFSPPLGVLLVLAISLWTWKTPQPEEMEPESSEPETEYSRRAAFIAILATVGVLALLAPMLFYIRGYFGDGDLRHQDTVFKFFLQAWLLLGTAAICGAINAARRLPVAWHKPARLAFYAVWSVPLLCSLTVLWTRISKDAPRSKDNYVHLTLNGARHLPESDQKAIEWLRLNAGEKDIVLEAVGQAVNEKGEQTMGGDYSDAARVSALSGVPSVLGWPQHVWFWGGDYGQITQRWETVRRIYNWNNDDEALDALKELNVRYVFVGGLEKQFYPAEALNRLRSRLQVVYNADGTEIYETPR